MDFSAPFRAQFRQAAAEGAALELRTRMLCEAVPALRHLAHGTNLEDAESSLAAHFVGHLSQEERALLSTARQLRNKVLHTNFRAAREKLREAGEQPGSGGVRLLSIDPAGDIRGQIEAALSSGAPGKAVADTASTKEGTIYGWLLEMGMSGDFLLAERTFERAIQVIERLIEVNAGTPG